MIDKWIYKFAEALDKLGSIVDNLVQRMSEIKMNYYFTGALIVLLCLLAFCVNPAYPNTTQNNTSGSNTSITGGYTSSATNTYQSGSSNNTTTTNNEHYQIRLYMDEA